MRYPILLIASLCVLVAAAHPASAVTLIVVSHALDGSDAPEFVTFTADVAGPYSIEVAGTYQYYVPWYPSYWADAGWATWDVWDTVRPKIDGGPVRDHPGGPWRYDLPAGILMLWMNDGATDFHEWGDYSASHRYGVTKSLAAGQQLTFWVRDLNHRDNSGHFTVDVTLIPEPASSLVLLCGLGGVIWRRRKRSQP